jgi:hypothetical protein
VPPRARSANPTTITTNAAAHRAMDWVRRVIRPPGAEALLALESTIER